MSDRSKPPQAILLPSVTVDHPPSMKAPIFIIGYPRSGTSFVGKLIATFTRLPSHGEAHTLTLLQEIHHQVNLYRRRTDFTGKELVKLLDLDELKDTNTRFFREFYRRTYGSDQFIDKTPGAVACHGWGVVKEVFPDAVFIACVRSPVEVYESAALKFGGRDGERPATDPVEVATGWVSAMRGIEQLLASPYAPDSHVVSQLQLRSDPATTVTKLFSFLGLPDSVVDDGIALCSQSREDVLTASIERPSYKTLRQASLPDAQAQQFREICAPVCEDWGIEL
ncbi:sulfotransferase [Synechococcus sp. FACHB-909]|uniref:sulfotransferase family protein n=1 Tax=Synechococcus sp. FACHB-909 TaxID=2692863 RepID=UPI0016853F34|nr:sulfotransferase [Synechococcus sp. FACHB-909]MBD2720074.1 sulfotransferase [Synechococcus sp. FACHB-909]